MFSKHHPHKCIAVLLLYLLSGSCQAKELTIDIPSMFYNTLTDNPDSSRCGNLIIFILLITSISLFFFILSLIKKIEADRNMAFRQMLFVLIMGLVLGVTVFAYYDQGNMASLTILWIGSVIAYGTINKKGDPDIMAETARDAFAQWKEEDRRRPSSSKASLENELEKWGSRFGGLGIAIFFIAPLIGVFLWGVLCIRSIYRYFLLKHI